MDPTAPPASSITPPVLVNDTPIGHHHRHGRPTRVDENIPATAVVRPRAPERWPELAGIDVKFRGEFAYVTGRLKAGDTEPLMRLRYGGSAARWCFAVYLASKDGYEVSVLPTPAALLQVHVVSPYGHAQVHSADARNGQGSSWPASPDALRACSLTGDSASNQLMRRRHPPVPEQGRWLASVVRGHVAYYAAPGNSPAMNVFRTQATSVLCDQVMGRLHGTGIAARHPAADRTGVTTCKLVRPFEAVHSTYLTFRATAH